MAEWNHIDFEKKELVIPWQNNRKCVYFKLKRDFYIPLVEPVMELIQNMHKVSGNSEFIFPSLNDHTKKLDPSQVNTSMKKIDKYKDQISGHGWRHFFTTHGQDVFKLDGDLIHFSTGHPPGGKVRSTYDSARHMDRRREMYRIWCDGLCDFGLDPSFPFKGLPI